MVQVANQLVYKHILPLPFKSPDMTDMPYRCVYLSFKVYMGFFFFRFLVRSGHLFQQPQAHSLYASLCLRAMQTCRPVSNLTLVHVTRSQETTTKQG
jgi:hypothetical protein